MGRTHRARHGRQRRLVRRVASRAWSNRGDPSRRTSPLSASYLIALAARIVREVSGLMRRAREAGKELATLSIDTEVRFKSAADRAAFAKELTAAVTTLVARYHDATTPGGRPHRLVVVAHPLPSTGIPRQPKRIAK